MSVSGRMYVASVGDSVRESPADISVARLDPHHDRRWLILGVVLSDATRQWVITAYVLAFGGLLSLGGRLADVFGRKLMFLIGLTGLAVASAAGGATSTSGTLIVARAIQGGFAAALAPAALFLVAVTFTDLKELNKAFGIFGAVAGSAGALGLLLGGVLGGPPECSLPPPSSVAH